MLVDVKLWIVNPVRVIKFKGDLDQSLAKKFGDVQS
jgi:hypothetical protein